MKHALSSEEKYHALTHAPLPRLILRLALPTILSSMISSIHSMINTYFVGSLGTSATAAVGVSSALMLMITAIGYTMGSGAGNFISRLLGQKDREHASKVLATGFVTALFSGVVILFVGILWIDPLVWALGSTQTIFPYAKEYVFFMLLGAPAMTGCYVLESAMRFQGSTFFAMLGLSAGAVINTILDPILIYTMGMGVGGAALATALSQYMSFFILLFYCGRSGTLPIKLRHFSPRWSIYREILKNGAPTFFRQALSSVAGISMNLAARPYGDAAIAAISISNRTLFLSNAALRGFGQGYQPVCGYNYGAGKYDRVREGFRFVLKVTGIALLLFSIGAYAFAPKIIAIFRRDDLEVIAIGATTLRLQCLVYPLNSWTNLTNMTMQSIGQSTRSSALSLLRQGLFFLTFIFTIPHFFGLLGVQLSQPLADLGTFLVAFLMGRKVMRELRLLGEEAAEEPVASAVLQTGSGR
ncbi:MATE family efflux transporter [Eubacteriales bacterium OttesenSCG-928-M02]|nr:MATE family efflux transporter [Eubacteriales bacterium OttesenSCG-928-M02]